MSAAVLSAEAVAKIRERAAGASHTRWIAEAPRKDGTARVYSPSRGPLRVIVPVAETSAQDAPFIAAARTDVPALCDTVDALRALLRKSEWLPKSEYDSFFCLGCGESAMRRHAADCEVKAALADGAPKGGAT